MKRLFTLATLLCFCLCSLTLTAVAAEDYSVAEESVIEFIHCISEDEYYSLWQNAVPIFGYDVYGSDFETIVGHLFYIMHENDFAGYVIINSSSYSVLEFSRGVPAYDKVPVNIADDLPKRLYINGMPAILQGSVYSDINLSGEQIYSIDIESDVVPAYSPQLQTKNCIVSAISNLMWHWSINGYSALTTGMTFNQVEDRIDVIMTAEGGYANANIPATIETYVDEKSSYTVTVTNQWNPTFSNLKSEVANRPCLLGFAAGSPYNDTVGHMTVCVGTRSTLFSKYVQVIDGWEDEIVEKAWGDYNDFISKVVLSS